MERIIQQNTELLTQLLHERALRASAEARLAVFENALLTGTGLTTALANSNVVEGSSQVVFRKDTPSHFNFARLPTEIQERIIGWVDAFASDEHEAIVKKKSAFIHMYLNYDDTVWYGVYKGTEPILNTLQNLAVANRRLYDLCRPWLWRVGSVELFWSAAAEQVTDNDQPCRILTLIACHYTEAHLSDFDPNQYLQ